MYLCMSSPVHLSLHLSIHLLPLIGVYSRTHLVGDRNTSFRRSLVHQRTQTPTFGSSLMTHWSPLPNLCFYPAVVYPLRPPTSPFCCDAPPTQFTHSYWQWWTHRALFCQVLIADLTRISVKRGQNGDENTPGDGTASSHIPNLSNINQNRRCSAKRLYLNVSKCTKTTTSRCQWGSQWRQGWCSRPCWLMCIGCSLKVVIEVPLQTSVWR